MRVNAVQSKVLGTEDPRGEGGAHLQQAAEHWTLNKGIVPKTRVGEKIKKKI